MSSADIQIVECTTPQLRDEFIFFQWVPYKGNSYWVPPLIEERLAYFNAKKNPFWEHSRYQLFVARRDGQLVGTIGSVVNDNHNKVHEELAGADQAVGIV